MTARIDRTFAELRKQGRKALVGYLTAGDPDIERSEMNIRSAIEQGVDILELGVPFSDPTADGPVIQQASQRALSAGMNVERTLDLVARLRSDFDVPIILFGYANPFFVRGYGQVCADAVEAGADGFLVVDMPLEENGEFRSLTEQNDLALIPLVAPTTPDDRAARILGDASGFVYYVTVMGITGQRDHISDGIADHLVALRKHTKLPIVVGFGISSGAQARAAGAAADGVVVGSALVTAAKEGNLVPLVQELHDALG